jgi:TolB protein
MTPARLRLGTAALVAVALVSPATASPAVAGTSLLGPDQVMMGDHVPWDRVGHGWYLTLVDQGPHDEMGIHADHQLLDLVDPLGGRYQMAKTTVGTDGSNTRRLVDWSPDGRTALEMVVSVRGPDNHAVIYDLEAGTHQRIDLGKHVEGASLGPDGSLYLTMYDGKHGDSVWLRDSDGIITLLARHTDVRLVPTNDGHRFVVGSYGARDHRLFVVDDEGRLRRTLTTPMECRAQRWWRPGVLMASCLDRAGGMRLYAVPIDGSRGHWLSADHGRRSEDLGDIDARRLDGTTYLEASGPCGVVFLARQHADGTATKVHVPDATQNVWLLGTRGDRLVLHLTVSCDGTPARDAISHFDPATGRDRVVALLPENEQYRTILGFRERQASL